MHLEVFQVWLQDPAIATSVGKWCPYPNFLFLSLVDALQPTAEDTETLSNNMESMASELKPPIPLCQEHLG